MANKKQKIELLAPAKNKETAFAAIDCGADAVYIGCKSFGARINASNSLEDVREVVDYAHKFRAKVYVTINTILNDDELESALKLIKQLYEIKADAVIIQDMGLLECDLPPIPVFASTQCHNDSTEKVKFLEQVSFQRAILARELSLQEIKNIYDNTNLELEAFIHGSLCVSYSGQCYMSYAIGSRSANRGECAQPCRKKYSLKDAQGKFIAKDSHLLCLKDLNLSKDIENLIKAGITSFKIEGRLKDIDYTRNIVSFYRQEIDKVLEKLNLKKSSQGVVNVDFEPNSSATFNRGYCDYFLNGRKKTITSFKTPKSTGEYIGKVIEIRDKSFKLDRNTLSNADGICYYADAELRGTNVNKIQNEWVLPQSIDGIELGTEIFRNYNHKFSKRLENAKISRKIPVKIKFEKAENTCKFSFEDEEGNSVDLYVQGFEEAKNPDMAKENLIKSFSKLGETEFFVDAVEMKLDRCPFIPSAELNKMRRELVQKLQQLRKEFYPQVSAAKIGKIDQYPQREVFYEANVMNEKSKLFYEKRGAKVSEMAMESGLDPAGKKLMTTKHCLKYSFDLCPKKNPKNLYKEPFYLVDEYGKEYLLKFDCKHCKMEIFY